MTYRLAYVDEEGELRYRDGEYESPDDALYSEYNMVSVLRDMETGRLWFPARYTDSLSIGWNEDIREHLRESWMVRCRCGGRPIMGRWDGQLEPNRLEEHFRKIGLNPKSHEAMKYIIGCKAYVRCSSCGLTVDGDDHCKAIEDWNARNR